MAKEISFIFESKVALGVSNDESAASEGLIEAVFTTWGAREGADGRRFNYQAQPFKEWAAALDESGKPLPMYFQHNDEALPVGEWTAFEFTDEGMSGSGRLFTNTTVGRDLYTVMKESPKMVGGVSVGAYADEWQMVDGEGNPMAFGSPTADTEGYFQITKGGLREVSIVMQPNNPEANINKLEYFREDGTADLKMIEKNLREAGLSKKDATAASSLFNQLIKVRDALEEKVKTPPNPSESDEAVEKETAILVALKQRELLKELSKRI